MSSFFSSGLLRDEGLLSSSPPSQNSSTNATFLPSRHLVLALDALIAILIACSCVALVIVLIDNLVL